MDKQQVKKEVKGKNFYLVVLDEINNFHSIRNIPKKHDISKQNLSYYIKPLKKQGFIVNPGYAVWNICGEYEEVKRKVKKLSLGKKAETPTTNLHALNINFPILQGIIRDKDWEVKNKLKNWIPKYKGLFNLGGLTIRNNNNKSITVMVKSRDLDTMDMDEVDNLAFKVRAFIGQFFQKEGVILDLFNCETKNINLATENKEIKPIMRKGEVYKLDLNKKAEPIFPKDDIDAWAMLDNSPKPGSVETNDKEWKREYLSMPFRIRDMFGLIHSQLELLKVQTEASTLLSKNIESHIPSWMSNVKVEQELKKLRRQINTKQKRLGEFF